MIRGRDEKIEMQKGRSYIYYIPMAINISGLNSDAILLEIALMML